ncbi:MAG: lactate racemase [Clostridia bacterium]|nr:lactate racemase [Clostridia bacterium]
MAGTKTVAVDYWDKKININVPEDALVLESSPPPGAPNPQELVRKAIDNPLGMPPLRELAKKGMKVTIAFDDPCRPAPPRQVVIPVLLEVLNQAGIPDEDITLLCATGNHCKFTKAQLRAYLGQEVFERFWPKGSANRLINHDCSDPDGLVYMGVSEMGDYVEYNKLLATSDLFIYCGTVQSSNWGGMTGCGVIIGLASARSMRSTHSWDVVGDPRSCHGDPRTMFYRSHKDAVMDQIEKFIGKKVFYVDCAVGQGGQVINVWAGHYKEIQEPAWKFVESIYQVRCPQADIVVVGIPQFLLYGDSNNPLIAFTGTTTAPRHWVNKHLVREGGVVIGVAQSNGQVNERLHPSYNEVMDIYSRCFTAAELYDYEDEFINREDLVFKYRYCHGYHPIHPFWLFYESQYIVDHCSKIIMSNVQNPGAFRKLGVEAVKDFDIAFARAKQIVGPNPRVIVLPSFWSKPRLQFYVE